MQSIQKITICYLKVFQIVLYFSDGSHEAVDHLIIIDVRQSDNRIFENKFFLYRLNYGSITHRGVNNPEEKRKMRNRSYRKVSECGTREQCLFVELINIFSYNFYCFTSKGDCDVDDEFDKSISLDTHMVDNVARINFVYDVETVRPIIAIVSQLAGYNPFTIGAIPTENGNKLRCKNCTINFVANLGIGRNLLVNFCNMCSSKNTIIKVNIVGLLECHHSVVTNTDFKILIEILHNIFSSKNP